MADPGSAASPALNDFSDSLCRLGLAEGFVAAGAVDIDPALPHFGEHVERLDRWLGQEFHGSMEWIRRGRDRRADPRLVFPEAESVFAVLLPYTSQPIGEMDPARGVRYARYLAGDDYHADVAGRLERVLNQAKATLISDLRWKVCVDTSAVLERSWAYLAGLGWIGKNTLLIHPKWGSYTFIGVAFLNRKVGRGPKPVANWCGSCDRCLKSCPTQAFPQPGILNSNRCISAMTLEFRGEQLPSEPELSTQNWVAGCDICQEVCPFNRKRGLLEADKPLHFTHPTTFTLLEEETPEQYKARIKNSALSRVKPDQFKRNLKAARAFGSTSRQKNNL
jgi:epoxyqueuosine reductase